MPDNGQVERGIGDQRGAADPYGRVFDSLEALQAWTHARVEDRAHRLFCPATGTSVAEAWEIERGLLTPLPETLPEPFDVVVHRPVGVDCMVSFEGCVTAPHSASSVTRSRSAASQGGCRSWRTAR